VTAVAGDNANASTNGNVVRLVAVRHQPLSVDEVFAAVRDPHAGGVAIFVGTVRGDDAGRGVTGLGYTAHPTVLDQLRAVADEVAASYPVLALAAVHRVGDLAVGDLAVVVGASCPHRGEAFAACRALIDELKSRVPIWKHQLFDDGGEEWVGLP